MLPLAAIGAGLGLVGSIGGIFAAKKNNKMLDKLLGQNPTYQKNPIAGQRLALAQQLLNARMPGVASMERNIYGNQANTLGQINRNATDASQALSLAAATQGQTNEAFNQLGLQENQDYYNRLQNLTGAQQGMIQEGDKVYQDQVRRYQDLAAIRGAQAQNRSNIWQSISNMGQGVMNFGLSGGGAGLFGGGGGSAPTSFMPQESNLPFSTVSGAQNPYSYNTGLIPLPKI